MPEITDAALPWVLLIGCWAGSALGAAAAVAAMAVGGDQ